MSEANIVLPSLSSGQVLILWLVLVSALVALGYGLTLVRVVLRASPGPKSMTDVADAIQVGAMAYLWRQIKTMAPFVAAITFGLFLMYRNVYEGWYLPVGIALAFFMGVTASYGAGFVGMWLAVRGNVRSANAALKSFKDAMEWRSRRAACRECSRSASACSARLSSF
jgi:K(+)-stimulated pyrophosphate-energized sodium pump